MSLSRNLSSIHKGLHELRFKDRTGAYRIFYFIKKADGIYFVHAFKKKTQELPQKEKRCDMAWKEMTVDELAKSLGVDVHEVREKHRLIELIKKARKEKKLSQVQLAKKMGVTQGRIAQIESRVGTAKVTLEILLSIIRELGYEYKIVAKRVA